MKDRHYIAIQRSGHYSNACQRRYWMTQNDCGVIEYGQFIRFINEGEATPPIFISTDYKACLEKAQELNEKALAQ